MTPLSEGHEGTLENYNAAREKKIPESQTAPAKPFGQRTYAYSPTLPASQEIPTYTTSVSTSASPRRRCVVGISQDFGYYQDSSYYHTYNSC